MLKNFSSLIEFQKAFSTELKCVNHLVQLRWKGNMVCPHCGSNGKIWTLSGMGMFKCKECSKKFSVRVGTIFEDSKLPLQKWFMAFYLEVAHTKGISSYQLAKDIDTRQETAWFVLQRIRWALAHNTIEKMKGDVEVDETYLGGSETNKHADKKHDYDKGANPNKMTVVGVLQRGGRVALEYITKSNIKNICPVLERTIDFDNASLYTDESPLYKRYPRQTTNHSLSEYVKGNATTNRIEGVFSHFKRYIYGTHHQITKKHLSKYINTFEFRYNNRTLNSYGKFNMALEMMFGKRLEYKDLIA